VHLRQSDRCDHRQGQGDNAERHADWQRVPSSHKIELALAAKSFSLTTNPFKARMAVRDRNWAFAMTRVIDEMRSKNRTSQGT
jgi:hypothetical protein